MWPFKRKSKTVTPSIPADQIFYSQLDITESFGDCIRLVSEDWIPTVPLNRDTVDPESVGLPLVSAGEEEVYKIASGLSQVRESVRASNDGVYCPVCHIANVDLAKLRTPCPKCGRVLLKFGWD